MTRFRMLGPLRVRGAAGWTAVRAPQQRVVLAVLLIEAGRVVSTDRLIDELWGDGPPRAASVTVQGYIRRLRVLIGDGQAGPLRTRGHGYELVLDDAELDAAVFERLVDSALDSRAGGEPDRAARLSEALQLWQGPALADVPPSPTVSAEAARLEQRRLTAVEERLGALLDRGRHAEVVGDLRRLVQHHPLRERLHGLLMQALYENGRRAEALEAYRAAYEALVSELGLEPGPQLQQLHRRILSDDRPAAVRTSKPAVPAQLPADVAYFTGRGAQLARLDALLRDAGDRQQVMVISTIAGTAGVGKTALAVHWAHHVRSRFPDGQLYVNMRGYGADRPLRPLDALAHFLAALGVPAEQVPAEPEAAAGLYRTLLAGKRVLVLIDDAAHPDQIRALLPGTPDCVVLVTSRDQLRGLVAREGAVRLDLDVLGRDEADRLLVSMIGPARTRAEPELVTELARLCGRLPLALRIVAANLIAHPHRPLAGLIAELTGDDRLSALAVAEDPQTAVRAAFDHSYAKLPAAVRRLFRLLGPAPGPDIGAPAAAALAGITSAEAAELLDELVAAHLVDRRPPGRYAMHDLIRQYATELADAEEGEAARQAASTRLYDHYLHGVAAAGELLYPFTVRLPPSAAPAHAPAFGDDVAALKWLDAERANLVAAVQHAAEHGPYEAAWRLADQLRGHLSSRVHTVEWATVAHAGVAAAEHDGDPLGRAAAHINLAMLHGSQGRHREAIDGYARAAELSRRADWPEAEAAAVGNAGNAHLSLGSLAEAADHYQRALELDRRSGLLLGEAAMLGNLGRVHGFLGRLEPAADALTQALALHRQTKTRVGEARNLANLGWACHRLGRTADALAHLTEALAVNRELGDRNYEGLTARALAEVHRDTGDHDRALDLADTALTLAREAGPDRYDESLALIVRADAHHRLGDPRRAVDGYEDALTLARDLGNTYLEAECLVGLATAERAAGRPGRAAGQAEAARAIAARAGYRLTEGNALVVLAAVALAEGRAEDARGLAERALAVHAEAAHPLGEARAHLLLAHALDTAGDHRAARFHHSRADALFAGAGAVVAEQARVLLGVG